MNVLDELQYKRGFTAGEEAIADYILAHVDEIPATSIDELARDRRCSKSSIVRLCRKIGLEGYRELRIEVTRELERKRFQIGLVDPNRPFAAESTTANIADALAKLAKQALEASYERLDLEAVRDAAQLILDSRRVVYYALGDSCAAMSVFVQLLYKIGVICTSGLPMGDRGVLGRNLDSHDVAIIVSYSGNLIDTYHTTIDALRARGCRTILITGNPSIGERLMGTDCLFILPDGEAREERLATFFSQTCTQYVLNCIFAEAYTANYQSNLDNWQNEMREYSNE